MMYQTGPGYVIEIHDDSPWFLKFSFWLLDGIVNMEIFGISCFETDDAIPPNIEISQKYPRDCEESMTQTPPISYDRAKEERVHEKGETNPHSRRCHYKLLNGPKTKPHTHSHHPAIIAMVIIRRCALYLFLLAANNSSCGRHCSSSPFRNNSIEAFSPPPSSSSPSFVRGPRNLGVFGGPSSATRCRLPLVSSTIALSMSTASSSSSATVVGPAPAWTDLQATLADTPVGAALDRQVTLRGQGLGAPHVHNPLRLFGRRKDGPNPPSLKLYRDHAGWCPYCQKTMLLIEAKEIPIQIELVNMRSYGDKPQTFLRKVPNGLLPALEVGGRGVITESAVIMELLDEMHPSSEGYRQMVPDAKKQPADYRRYQELSQLERELFRWWCTLMFRPEGAGGGVGGMLGGLFGGNAGGADEVVSPAMEGFFNCLQRVDTALRSTKGPFFLDYTTDHPTMIDFVFASHVERMFASCAYWKGMDLRNQADYDLPGLQAWMDALEKEEYYLAFKSDYYTHVKDIPPQYGPGYDGISRRDKIAKYQASILGTHDSWKLPLSHDDALQPLYRGPPLPLCVLEAAGIKADDGRTAGGSSSYEKADPSVMAKACRLMAAWKLASNGPKVSIFASRGGPSGSKNIRKTFGAELADPYAESDAGIVDAVDAALRVTVLALQDVDGDPSSPSLQPSPTYVAMLRKAVPASQTKGVVSSLAYLRDRIGVPRDLPLASARYLRAYLNWAIDSLQK